jgi:hypothetical protein
MSKWDKLRATIKQKADTKYEKKAGIFKQGVIFPLWKPDNIDHEIDIIPYKIGPNDPRIGKEYDTGKVYAVGDDHYTLELFVHKTGPDNKTLVICPNKNYGLKCPICDYYLNLQKNGEKWENYVQYMPGKYPRSIYNVICYTTPAEEAKGIQVWHTSAYLFEIHLAKLATGSARNKGNYIYFPDPEVGKSIAFTKEGIAESTKFMGIKFLDRDYAISEETMKKSYCLDSLVHIPTYAEVYKLFYGEDCPDEPVQTVETTKETPKETPPPRTRGERKPKAETLKPEPVKEEKKPEPVREPENQDVFDIDTMTRKELIALIKEEKIDLGGDPSDWETDEIKAALRKMIDAPVTAEEKEPEPKTESKPTRGEKVVSPASKCPNGLVFGKDCDTTPECEKCDSDLWKACTSENKKLRDASRNVTTAATVTEPVKTEEPKPTVASQPSTGGSRLRRRG